MHHSESTRLARERGLRVRPIPGATKVAKIGCACKDRRDVWNIVRRAPWQDRSSAIYAPMTEPAFRRKYRSPRHFPSPTQRIGAANPRRFSEDFVTSLTFNGCIEHGRQVGKRTTLARTYDLIHQESLDGLPGGFRVREYGIARAEVDSNH